MTLLFKRLINPLKLQKPAKPNGFSLVEVLIVVAIIGLLAGLVGPAALRQFQSSKTKTAEIQIQQLRNTLDIFLLDVGRYPDETEGLSALVSNTAGINGWAGPYLKDAQVPLDPWGRDYILEIDANAQIRIKSLGADGVAGGEGPNRDIVS